MDSPQPSNGAPRRGLGRRHRVVLLLLLGLLVLSVAARALAGERAQPKGPGEAAVGGAALVAGGSGPAPGGEASGGASDPNAADRLFAALPYLTEASFFALVGFALGYASRKALKVGLLVLALVFLAIQGLVLAGVAQVDWGALVEKLNTLLFHVREDTSVGEWLRTRVPSAGGLVAGYLLGFRRG